MVSFFTDLWDDIEEGASNVAASVQGYFNQPAQDKPAAAPDNFSLLLAATIHEFSMMENAETANEAQNLEEAFNIAMQSMLENADNPAHAAALLEEIATNPVFGDPMQREQLIQRLNGAMEHMPEGPARMVVESGLQAIAGNRAQLSDGIEAAAELAVARGVRYGMGAKANGDNFRSIDCSGLVHYTLQAALGREAASAMANHSEGQVVALMRRAGGSLDETQLNADNVVEGMVIGIDSGDRGFDRGRELGIDHVVITYRDSETGEMMVAESRGGRGAMVTDFDDWLAMAHRRGYELTAVDSAALRPDILENSGSRGPALELA